MVFVSGWLAGCGATFPAALALNTDDVDQIVNNDGLEPQEKRDELAALGVREVTINALLADETFANQFGGTLTTGREKVVAETFRELTPDEIQQYGDALGQPYNDAQGQAIHDLFAEEFIDNPDELETFLDDPGTELDPAISDVDLRATFIDGDPDSILDELP